MPIIRHSIRCGLLRTIMAGPKVRSGYPGTDCSEDTAYRCNRAIRGLVMPHFTVADYKAPTFRVVTSGTDGECVPGDTVRISGEAPTYAGMPVAGAKVAYKVTYRQPWWWRRDTQGASFASETVTGPDGKFVISLPTASLRGTRYERGVFQLDVDVTDKAGETQPASPVMFSMTRAYTISPCHSRNS